MRLNKYKNHVKEKKSKNKKIKKSNKRKKKNKNKRSLINNFKNSIFKVKRNHLNSVNPHEKCHDNPNHEFQVHSIQEKAHILFKTTTLPITMTNIQSFKFNKVLNLQRL